MTTKDLNRGNPEWATFAKNAKAAGIEYQRARQLWKDPLARAKILGGEGSFGHPSSEGVGLDGDPSPTADPGVETVDTPEDVEFRRVTQASQEEFDGAGGPTGSIQVDPLAWGFETIFFALGAILNPIVETPQGMARVQVWAVHPKDAKRMARAWMAWVRSLPKRQRMVLTKLTNDIMPTITLVATFGSIVGARIDQTVKWRRAGRVTPPQPAPSRPATTAPPPPSNGDGRVAPGAGDPLDPAFLREQGFDVEAA